MGNKSNLVRVKAIKAVQLHRGLTEAEFSPSVLHDAEVSRLWSCTLFGTSLTEMTGQGLNISPLMKKLCGRFHFHSCSPEFLFKCKFPSEQQRPINVIDPRTHQELKEDAAITRMGILHPLLLLHILCGSSDDTLS